MLVLCVFSVYNIIIYPSISCYVLEYVYASLRNNRNRSSNKLLRRRKVKMRLKIWKRLVPLVVQPQIHLKDRHKSPDSILSPLNLSRKYATHVGYMLNPMIISDVNPFV